MRCRNWYEDERGEERRSREWVRVAKVFKEYTPEECSVIVGRRGAFIRNLMEQSGCIIQQGPNPPRGVTVQRVEFKGTPAQVKCAIRLIAHQLAVVLGQPHLGSSNVDLWPPLVRSHGL